MLVTLDAHSVAANTRGVRKRGTPYARRGFVDGTASIAEGAPARIFQRTRPPSPGTVGGRKPVVRPVCSCLIARPGRPLRNPSCKQGGMQLCGVRGAATRYIRKTSPWTARGQSNASKGSPLRAAGRSRGDRATPLGQGARPDLR